MVKSVTFYLRHVFNKNTIPLHRCRICTLTYINVPCRFERCPVYLCYENGDITSTRGFE